MWQNFVKEYFTLSRKERKGIYLLILIIIICLAIPFFLPLLVHPPKIDYSEFGKEVSELKNRADSQRIKDAGNYNKGYYNRYYNRSNPLPTAKGELFYFDPNTAESSDWKRLGLRDKTISTIEKYISKGGHFYKPEDLGRIWGLREVEVKRLLPYVRIVDRKQLHSNEYQNNFRSTYKSFHKIEMLPFDVNKADSATLDSLPGIGPRLAKRIIAFRDKLGGFTSVEQVKETYALPDSTFNKIKSKLFIKEGVLKKININTCTLDQLKIHPYFRYAIANAIIQYRSQHGPFKEARDLKKIMIVSDSIYDKITPYLIIQ